MMSSSLPEPCDHGTGRWAVMVNKPEMRGVYNYYVKRLDAELIAQTVDGWVLANGLQARAVAERLTSYPEADHGSRRDK